MACQLVDIRRYPVKGLNGQSLEHVELAAGCPMPLDRRYAIALGSTRVQGERSEWQPRRSFLMLAANERLAELDAVFEESSRRLVLHRRGRAVCQGALDDAMGRRVLEDFLSAFMGAEARGAVKLVEIADGDQAGSFADTPGPYLSLINRRSVADIERVAGGPVDPRRFRGNLIVDGAPAWSEFGWIGRTLQAGDVRLRVVDRIERCAATNVDPDSATRDMNIPRALMKGFGHADCGVFVEVVQGGRLVRDAGVRLEP